MELVPSMAHAQASNDAAGTVDERASLERELAAQDRVPTGDPRYADAMSRAGWICFLLDRPAEAIARFTRVLDVSPPGTSPHDEALQMLGALFADVDWDRDGRVDPASPRARLEDRSIVAQDRPWLAALYFATARALHLTVRDADAVALIELALSRWPAPSDGTVLVAACERHRARQATASLHVDRLDVDAICARRAPP